MASFLEQFSPALRAPGITAITPAFLNDRGIRALILDLDNTLVPWKGREVPVSTEEWIRTMQHAGIKLCIVSNTHRPRRLAELAAVLGVQYVPSGGKPRRRGFFQAMTSMGVTADETAVVGDQVMTDIWGGNRCRLLTILVDPMTSVEFVGTRVVSRSVEKVLLRLLAWRGTRHEMIEVIHQIEAVEEAE